jgi:hypothetical protein
VLAPADRARHHQIAVPGPHFQGAKVPSHAFTSLEEVERVLAQYEKNFDNREDPIVADSLVILISAIRKLANEIEELKRHHGTFNETS